MNQEVSRHIKNSYAAEIHNFFLASSKNSNTQIVYIS